MKDDGLHLLRYSIINSKVMVSELKGFSQSESNHKGCGPSEIIHSYKTAYHSTWRIRNNNRSLSNGRSGIVRFLLSLINES